MEVTELPGHEGSFLSTSGVFTTEDLMRIGLSREQANEIIERLSDDELATIIPIVSTSN